jgi:hypothetical protein
MLTLADLRVDPEFEALCPPLDEKERLELAKSIERDGFLTPLIVWLHHGILLDGHNRLSLFRQFYEHDEDKPGPEIVEIPCKDRDEAKRWILAHQLARRNLNDADRDRLLAMLYAARKGTRGGDRSSSHGETMTAGDTAAQVAAEAGVSRATVHRAVQTRTAVETIRKADPEAAAAIESGAAKVPRKRVLQVAALPEADRPAAARELVAPHPRPTAKRTTPAVTKPVPPPTTGRTTAKFPAVLAHLDAWTRAKLRTWDPYREPPAAAEQFLEALWTLAEFVEKELAARIEAVKPRRPRKAKRA